MKRRRTAFLLLGLLSAIVVLLLCGLAFAVATAYRQMSCAPAESVGLTCDRELAWPPVGLLVSLGCVGIFVILSFAWLAWQETLILRHKRRQAIRQRLFEQSEIILPTGASENDDRL